MALKLKSLIVEQSERADITALNNILQQQHAIFTEALNKLKSIEYSTLPEYGAKMLKDKSNILCEAYTEYCDNTKSAAKDNPNASIDNIVDDNAGTLFDRVSEVLES